MALTRRQKEVLDVIQDFIHRKGYSPSLEEIGAALDLSSVATVHKHVTHLVEKGLVRRVWNQNRSIELVGRDAAAGIELPLRGTIAAGRPMETVPVSERLCVPADMVSDGERAFVLRVEGDSMIEEQIRDGDFVVVEEKEAAGKGETVVAQIDGGEVTLKRLFHEGDTARLQPANPILPPIVVPADRLRVQGVVVGVIRRY